MSNRALVDNKYRSIGFCCGTEVSLQSTFLKVLVHRVSFTVNGYAIHSTLEIQQSPYSRYERIIMLKATIKALSRVQIILLLSLVFYNTVLQAQVGKTVRSSYISSPPASGDTWPGFSPSLATVNASGSELLIAAWVSSDQSISPPLRKIRFSKSTDQGVTWSQITGSVLPLPSGYSNEDEPQLAAIGGNYLVCAVRCFADGSGTNAILSPPYQEQPHGLHYKTGIFFYVSTNQGATWSTPTSVQEDGEVSGTITSLEYPRVTYRPGHDTKGYISWEKRVYSYDNTNFYQITSSAIGIKAFAGVGDGYISSPGSIYPDGRSTPYIITSSGNGRPMRPTVAIAPDSSVWVAYYNLDWSTVANVDGTPVSPQVAWSLTSGTCISTPSGGSGTVTFNGFGNPVTILSGTNYRLAAQYSPNRGLFLGRSYWDDNFSHGHTVWDLSHGPSVQVAVLNPYGCRPDYQVGVAFVTDLNSPTNYDLDGTYTPNIIVHQVPQGHSILQFFAATVHARENSTVENQSTWFNNLRRAHDSLVQERVEIDNPSYQDAYNNTITLYNQRWMPTLRYTNVDPSFDYLTKKTRDARVNTVPRSFFALGYFHSEQEKYDIYFSGDNWPMHFFELEPRAVVSFDNQTFHISNVNRTINNEHPGDSVGSGAFAVFSMHLGSQLDLNGSFGKLNLHMIWHRMADNTVDPNFTGEKLQANTGGCVYAIPYYDGFPNNDANGFATTNIFQDQEDHAHDGSTQGDWSQYCFWDFMGSQRNGNSNNNTIPYCTGLNVTSTSLTPGTTSGLSNSTAYQLPTTTGGGGTSHSFFVNTPKGGSSSNIYGVGDASAAALTSGIYYAVYSNPNLPVTNFGLLNYSDQRKIVTTGDVVHGIFERGGKVYYATTKGEVGAANAGYNTANLALDWQEPMALGPVNSGATMIRPSIAVYSAGNGQGCSGTSAIGVVWVEITNVSGNTDQANVYFKTREFDMCTGNWSNWSQTYLIHKHTFPITPLFPPNFNTGIEDQDDGTTPVVAPLERPGMPGPGMASATLLGWTITWTCPRLNPAYALPASPMISTIEMSTQWMTCVNPWPSGVYSRTWLRANGGTVLDNNSSWGQYSNPTSALMRPVTGSIPEWNILRETGGCTTEDPQWQYGSGYRMFPTVVSSENKHTDAVPLPRYVQQIAYSGDGNYAGIWFLTESYLTSGTIGSRDAANSTPPTTPVAILATNSTKKSFPVRLWDRNPCITMNSSGQQFVAWERIDQRSTGGLFSEIMVDNSLYNLTGPVSSWGTKTPLVVFIKQTNVPTGSWLINPSIAGFPKNNLDRDPAGTIVIGAPTGDPGAVELEMWEKTLTSPAVHQLRANMYREVPNQQPGTGNWVKSMLAAQFVGNGAWSQASFGLYNPGPKWADINNPVNPIYRSYFFGNTDDVSNTMKMPVIGYYPALKGTFDSPLGVALYSGERRWKDSSSAVFEWGDVYVDDTASMLPMRQVMMHAGANPSGFSSHEEERDSIFRTEVFDWPAGSALRYFRQVSVSDPSAITSGGDFMDTTVSFSYAIQVVLASNDSVIAEEDVQFAPGKGSLVNPRTVHLINLNDFSRDVYLRVTGTVNGVSDDDSLVEFYIEQADSCFTSVEDSTGHVLKQNIPNQAPLTGSLSISAPFPNPLDLVQQSYTHLSVAYAPGQEIRARVTDLLGKAIITIDPVISTGNWQELTFKAPPIAGSYIINVSAGNESRTVPFVVK